MATSGTGGATVIETNGRMNLVTAIRLRDGRVLLGGSIERSKDEWVAVILRLDAAGRIDTSFGNAGYFTTSVGDFAGRTLSLRALSDGRLLAAVAGTIRGPVYSDCREPESSQLIRVAADGRVIVGDSGGGMHRLLGGAGIARGGIGIQRIASVPRRDGTSALAVSRSGGSSGAVSVTYSVREIPAGSAQGRYLAIAGVDFVAATGRIDWADGETGEKIIPVTTRLGNAPPQDEYFQVTLDSTTGGAVIFGGVATLYIQGSLATTPPSTPGTPAAPSTAASGGGGALALVDLLALALAASLPAFAARFRRLVASRSGPGTAGRE